MRRFTLLAAAVALAVSGCTNDVGVSREAVSHSGPWDIPADTAAIGDTQYVEYTGAGPWVGPSGCGGSLSAGAQDLRDWLPAAFPQIEHIGGYSCRSINGDSTTMSVHATGRALDIHIPTHMGDADNDLGDPVGNWLIENAEAIGIQYIIWDRWTWGAHRAAGEKERSYGGAHPHHDHLHVELSVEGSRRETPWFSGPRTLPSLDDCAPMGPDGGTLEESDACFAAYGPATYWRSEAAGHGGSLLWTNAFESDTPSNWARWHLTPATPGDYAVEIWAEPGYAVHRAARFAVRHAGEEHALEVDLSGASGWVQLGVFAFDGGGAEHVSVYDHSPTPVEPEQRIPADALRLVRMEDGGPTPDPGPRTTSMIVVTDQTYPAPIWHGDPTIDDDGALTGGCSATAGRSAGPIALVFGLASVVAARRRRRRPAS